LTPQKLEEKEQNGFVIVVIVNTLKVISVLRRICSTYLVKRRKKRNKKHQDKRIYTRNQMNLTIFVIPLLGKICRVGGGGM